MLNIKLDIPQDRAPRFLFIGAHCDDIEIGCGGTVMELLQQHPDAVVRWVVLSGNAIRRKEGLRAAKSFLQTVKEPVIDIRGFRESYFPSEVDSIKGCFEEIKENFAPDIIYTHFREDLHQDHRVVGELTWNTFRNHTILEYEIPKYDGGLGSPSVFVEIDKRTAERKIATIIRVFKSQQEKHWFTSDVFHSILRLRGIECNSRSGYAEAFYSRKLVLARGKS